MKLDEINILYHGTGIYHEQIDLRHSNRFKDFGRGYYVTSHRQQADSWAKAKGKRLGKCWVFEYALAPVPDSITVKELLRYDEEWLNFITRNRLTGEETPFDIVYDRMADNQSNVLAKTLRDYAYGYIDPKSALNIIRFHQRNRDQYCFKTPAAVQLLKRTRTHTYQFSDGTWEEELL